MTTFRHNRFELTVANLTRDGYITNQSSTENHRLETLAIFCIADAALKR